MNGTVYQGSLSRRYLIALAALKKVSAPVGLRPSRLHADLLRNWLDLMVFDPHGLVGQLLVVECVTNWAGHSIIASAVSVTCFGGYSYNGFGA